LKAVAIAFLVAALSSFSEAKDKKNQYTLAVEIMATQTAANATGREAEAHCKDGSNSVDCTARELRQRFILLGEHSQGIRRQHL
jgi:hypothetical protein